MLVRPLSWLASSAQCEFKSVYLSLDLHTSYLEKKLSLSDLSIESLPRTEEDTVGQQILPELLNKMFSTKSTQCMCSKCHSVMVPCFWHTCISKVCTVEASGNRHTHTQTKTQNDYRNPRACAERLINLDPSSCTCLQLDMPMHQLTLLQLHTLYSNEQHTFAAYTENQHFCM